MIALEAPVETFDEIDSTMLEARRRAERGETGPVWLVARKQLAGRGRRGRAWVSEEGNLYATYYSTTDRKPADLALLGFAAGLAICDAIEAEIGEGRTRLKWPNDVLIDGAKVSGLLLDSGPLPQGGLWAALGIGVNIAHAPEALDQPTTCVRAHAGGRPVPAPLAFLQILRGWLGHWDGVFLKAGFEPLRKAWLKRAYGLGDKARVAFGEHAVEGVIAGLSPRGELELETAEGPRLIAAGDVLLPNAA